jgi:ribosome-associated translation inhibitor RaiA
VVVEVSIDIGRRVVRAHASGHDFLEAIDLAQERLRDRLKHTSPITGGRRSGAGTASGRR